MATFGLKLEDNQKHFTLMVHLYSSAVIVRQKLQTLHQLICICKKYPTYGQSNTSRNSIFETLTTFTLDELLNIMQCNLSYLCREVELSRENQIKKNRASNGRPSSIISNYTRHTQEKHPVMFTPRSPYNPQFHKKWRQTKGFPLTYPPPSEL